MTWTFHFAATLSNIHITTILVQEPGFFLTLIKELGLVKAKCHEVFSYSFTCFPLVYTQVRADLEIPTIITLLITDCCSHCLLLLPG